MGAKLSSLFNACHTSDRFNSTTCVSVRGFVGAWMRLVCQPMCPDACVRVHVFVLAVVTFREHQ